MTGSESGAALCFLMLLSRLYSTLLPQAGRQLELCWRTSWDSHPSEDLSELRKQKYHYRLTGSWRGQLAKAVLA